MLADSIDDIGITDDNGPFGFSKTVSIFIGFFALAHLKYFNHAIFKINDSVFQNYIFKNHLEFL